jgi:hypothetical protein
MTEQQLLSRYADKEDQPGYYDLIQKVKPNRPKEHYRAKKADDYHGRKINPNFIKPHGHIDL